MYTSFPPKYTSTNRFKLAGLAMMAMAFSLPAFAGENVADTAPQFSVKSNATRAIGSAASAFEGGDFAKSATFSRYALKQGLKKSRKTVAYSNLCAALGAQGEYGAAIEACDSAIKIAPTNWQAYTNRAAANWLSGNKEAAQADIEKANKKNT